jgi:flagellar biosynthesis/type III secretory pathway protein FliH
MGLANGISGNQGNDDYYSSPEYMRAVLLGSTHRAQQARTEGASQGYNQGFNDGQQSGYDKGWNDGIDRGNRELLKADGYIKGHIADKERLQQTVNEQAGRIAQLLAHIATLEGTIDRKDDSMRVIQNSPLPQMARELQAENEQLRVHVQALQTDNDTKAQECVERAWQANRAAAVINAMRNTLEALTSDKNSERSKEIEDVLCEEYKKEIATGLEQGYLQEPLENDAIFAKTMPATHRFLTSMLQSVNERIELERVGQQNGLDDDGNWVPDGS